MRMSVSTAFNRTACGTISSQAAQEYDAFLSNYYAQLRSYGGWLSEVVDKVQGEHTEFMNSRMWEFGRIGREDIGQYVGQYEIGYLRTLSAQQNAKGYMCSVIMANPMLYALYEQDRVDGYSGTALHKFCTGLGEENYFYRKIVDSTMSPSVDNPVTEYKRYLSTRDKLTTLSEREREDALRTWRATESFISRGNDPTSLRNEPIKSLEEVEMQKKNDEIVH